MAKIKIERLTIELFGELVNNLTNEYEQEFLDSVYDLGLSTKEENDDDMIDLYDLQCAIIELVEVYDEYDDWSAPILAQYEWERDVLESYYNPIAHFAENIINNIVKGF